MGNKGGKSSKPSKSALSKAGKTLAKDTRARRRSRKLGRLSVKAEVVERRLGPDIARPEPSPGCVRRRS